MDQRDTMTDTTPFAHAAAEAASSAASRVAVGATVGGGITSGVGGALSSEFTALAGLTVAAVGLLVQLVLGFRRDRREQAEYELRMEQAHAEHAERIEQLKRQSWK